jgi:UDP-GlcNAc:undecaprenyl-phosphate/decaprenyl-phosphate GlcNAc-1-phosphate transferase
MKFAILTALCSAIVLIALRAMALKLNWLDHPDARKAHDAPVPAVGGLAWMLALLLGGWATGLVFSFPYLFGGAVLICVVGAIDDRFPLSSIGRLLLQALAVVLVFWDSVPLQNVGALLWPHFELNAGVLAWPLTIFACVGVINAVNMIDGMDGLLGVVLLATLALLLGFFHRMGLANLALLVGLMIAALLPFLCLNVRTAWLKNARVFFGDAGSMSAGLMLAWLLVSASQQPLAVYKPVSALFWLAVPLIDTVSLMLRRLLRGNSPFRPDQEHLHHLFQRAGFSVTQTLIMLLLATLTFQGLGIGMYALKLPEALQLTIFLSLALSYHLWITRAVTRDDLLGRRLAPAVSRS